MHANGSARSNEAENSRSSASTPAGRVATPLPALLALQRSAGNAAVVRMLRQAGHPWAQERHQHSTNCGHQQAEQPVQRSTVPDVLRSPGRPLDDNTRTEMEARLGADFSDVRLHTDTTAQASAAEVGARAYTSGSHVVLAADGTDRHTLAHELVHVIQQRRGAVSGTDTGQGFQVSDPSDRFEREADAVATSALTRTPPTAAPRSDQPSSSHRQGQSVQRSALHDVLRSAGQPLMAAPLPEVQHAPAGGRPAPATGGISIQLARHETGPTERDPDSENYDSDGDNFDTVYESQLPQPTSEGIVATLVRQQSEQHVTLWRGTELPRAEAMEMNGSVGGGRPDKNASAPDLAASRDQVAYGRRLPEFTTRTGVAEGFSQKGALVVVSIAAKYLTRGSVSEQGWTALPSAPLRVLELVDRTQGQQPGRRVNAS